MDQMYQYPYFASLSILPPLSMQSKLRCNYCYKFKGALTECKKCAKVFYCSEACKNAHASAHVPFCKPQKLGASQHLSKSEEKGLVGLQNLGNTCYINSCLQCLSHTQELTQYFLSQAYRKQINQDNPMGTSGKLAEAYAAFVQHMWSAKKQPYRPIQIKKIIGNVNPQFQNYHQEDANSYFTTLIDTLHEDLNRVKTKPNKPPPDVYGKHVEDGARISWLHYFSRNQSIITDTMTGLFKSTLYCHECHRQSLTFDTFTEVCLPIPNFVQQTQLTFYVLYSNFRKPIKKSTIQYQQISQDRLAFEAKKKIGQPSRQFQLYFLSENKQILNCQTVEKESFDQQMKQQRAFLVEVSQMEEPISNKNMITCFFSRSPNTEFTNIWIKRPFFIDLKNQTARSFTATILKYLYNTVYKFPQQRTIFGTEGMSYERYETELLQKQESYDKIFKLILLKTAKREGKRIVYDLQKYVEISGDQLIFDRLKDLIEVNEDEKIQSLMEKFELTIQVQKQAGNYFDFDRLHDGLQKQKINTGSFLDKLEELKQAKQITLQKCLDAFGCEENLNNDNLWYCAWCERQVKANKKLSIYRTPDVLVFVINRFKLRQDGRREKNITPVNIPFELDLEKYVVDSKPMSCFIDSAKKKCIYENPAYPLHPNLHPIQKFELYAFIHHRGELNNGHYMAYAKKDGRWYLFNDKIVEQVSAKNLDWRDAYVLFYRRHRS